MVVQAPVQSASQSVSDSAAAGRSGVRFRFLDGLRGWAAVVVLLHHLFVDGLPANSFMADRLFWSKFLFMNGTFAVCLFFVSGDAVAPLRGGTLWWS